MNIFFLSYNIEHNAKYYCDKHVVKIILELVQMLYSAHQTEADIRRIKKEAPYNKSGKHGYRPAYTKHPMTMWVRETEKNYLYSVLLALNLCKEYTYRYNKEHSCEKHVFWLLNNIPTFLEVKYSEDTIRLSFLPYLTKVPICISDKSLHLSDTVKSYRNYYNYEKAKFAKWTKRDIPHWFENLM